MRCADQLNIGEQNDIIRSIRAVAGNDGAVVAMVRTKAKQHAVQEDTIRLVVMAAALMVQSEQLELAESVKAGGATVTWKDRAQL